MNGRIGWLAGILGAQLVLIAALWLGAGAGDRAPEAFVDLDADAVSEIAVSDGSSSVTLVREDAGWRVEGTPADDAKIAEILDKIAGLTAAWPVATSAASAERFEVTADSYQRHVVLRGGGEDLAEFYLGTSPGYQRVHARLGGSDEVYSVELSNYEVGVNVDAWMDKTLLASASEPKKIHVVVVGDALDGDDADEDALQPLDATLERSEEGWLIDGVAADQDEAQTYGNRFKTLRVLGIVSGGDDLRQVATLEVVDEDGEYTLTVFRRGDDTSDYVVGSSRVDGRYRMAAYVAEQIMMTDVDFLPEPEESAEPEEGDENAAAEAPSSE